MVTLACPSGESRGASHRLEASLLQAVTTSLCVHRRQAMVFLSIDVVSGDAVRASVELLERPTYAQVVQVCALRSLSHTHGSPA